MAVDGARGVTEPAERACPQCGAVAKVRYRTVMQDGVRMPVDPRLVCLNGHDLPLRGGPGTHATGTLGEDDEGLIG